MSLSVGTKITGTKRFREQELGNAPESDSEDDNGEQLNSPLQQHMLDAVRRKLAIQLDTFNANHTAKKDFIEDCMVTLASRVPACPIGVTPYTQTVLAELHRCLLHVGTLDRQQTYAPSIYELLGLHRPGRLAANRPSEDDDESDVTVLRATIAGPLTEQQASAEPKTPKQSNVRISLPSPPIHPITCHACKYLSMRRFNARGISGFLRCQTCTRICKSFYEILVTLSRMDVERGSSAERLSDQHKCIVAHLGSIYREARIWPHGAEHHINVATE